MSYDTSIIDGAGDELVDVGNITSNIGPMYRAVLPGPYPGGGRYGGTQEADPRSGLTGLSDLRCSDVVPLLSVAVDAMMDREEEMVAMEPENGWGTYDGALRFLRRLLRTCEMFPDETVAVCW